MPARKPRSTPKATRSAASPEEGLRYAAELAFTMTPGPMSAEELIKRPQMTRLSVAQVRRWVEEGHWDQLRRDHFDALRQQLRQKMSQDLVQGKARQIADLESLWEQGMVMLEDPKLVPKQGWEGMAQSLLRIGDSLDKTRKGIMREVLADVRPGQASKDKQVSMGEGLHADEARAAARAIVQARQARLRLAPSVATPQAGAQ